MEIVNLSDIRKPPLVIGDDDYWKAVDGYEDFFKLVNPINYEFTTNPETTTVKRREISCYENACLLKVEDKNWKEDWAIFYFLQSSDEYYQLGSINESIWEINKKAKLVLKKSSIPDYLKILLYFYTISESGSVLFFEGPESEFSPIFPFSNELEKKKIFGKLKPPIISGPDKKGGFIVKCTIPF